MTTRLTSLALTVATALLLATAAGCSSESSERKAFMGFLQEQILAKPGMHVPRPNDDEKKKWGGYAKDYAIITNFDDNLNAQIGKPMADAIKRGNIASVQDLLARKSELADVRKNWRALGAALDTQFAIAEKAHAELKQPDDLKTVFDAAYERDVAAPAKAMKASFPVGLDLFDEALALADFLEANRSRVEISGSIVSPKDAAIRGELKRRLEAMAAKAQKAIAAQRHFGELVYGSK